ncbi:AraC family transcriptional regulator [Mucilaginibacter galii]|uniref:HTH araC/xylS-type domain-containing protein n=1 Tax=Mucilaginibacter galii TaxID=2005073 RepID=A0A917JC03_9SPHI|nr:hypothetical protein [Mucilaginibacter galii]GGI52441.1 hypothetical protein GCM10011425_36530 [Mucilaginibacter galii]
MLKDDDSVQHVADKLNVLTKYFSSLLKQLTGQTTQQHIQNKLIDKAKEKLSTISSSVNEITYQLGLNIRNRFLSYLKQNPTYASGISTFN